MLDRLVTWVKSHKVLSQGIALLAVVSALMVFDAMKPAPTLPSGIQLGQNSRPVDQSYSGKLECALAVVDRKTTSSSKCLGCHDGSVSKLIPTHSGVDVHPSGRVYPANGAYHPASTLGPEVVLVNGRLECTSCHDGAAKTRNHVVQPARVHLCQVCHAL